MIANTASTGAPALPDVNAETYPFRFVQLLLDETADANLLAVPQPGAPGRLSLVANRQDYFGLNGGYGVAIRSDLRRFESTAAPACGNAPLVVRETAGETVGVLSSVWLFGPAGLEWTPGRYPPPALMDPWRSQRFAVLDAHFDFGGNHEFTGYGIGRTFPITVRGEPRVLVGAVGNVLSGYGKFAGLEGTFVMTGSLVSLGFLGNVTIRFVDPGGVIRTEREIAPPTVIANPDPASAYVVMRGVKRDASVKTEYGPPPGDNRVNLVTPSIMKSAQYVFNSSGRGPQSNLKEGPFLADMRAEVLFDLLAPPGTADHPVPFTTAETYSFPDAAGSRSVIHAGVVDGISFQLRFRDAPRQQGVRFAGFGPITDGTGAFAGVQGMLTVNSLIGIAPHALSLIHVLHLVEAPGALRGTVCR